MSPLISSTSPLYAQAHQARALQELAPRTPFSKGKEALAVAIDILSLGRNSTIAASVLSTAEFAAKAALPIAGMVVAGGALAFVGGLGILKGASDGMKNSYDHGDWEGGFSQGTFGAIGLSYSIAGGGMIAAQSAALASAATVAAVSTSVFLGSALALYAGVGAYASHGLVVNGLFRHNLNKMTNDPTQLKAAVAWILQQVGHAGSKTELHKKWDRFAFRTSEACCRYVREHVTPEFLIQVEQGNVAAVKEASFILREVKRENAKQLVKHGTLMVIAAIGIAAVVLAILIASGPFSPILLAAAAVVWLLIDSSQIHLKFAEFCCGKSEIPPPKLPDESGMIA